MNDQMSPSSLEVLASILANFHGREYGDAIDRDTRFFGDLGLASIDAVVLGEALDDHFGRKLPFGELMGDLGRRTDRDMTIGELADFLDRHLAAPSPAA